MLAYKNRFILSKNPIKLEKRIESGPFLIKFKKTESPFKAAIIVSKKVAKKAVDRNRIRRIISEALATMIVPDLDLVIIVKENIQSLKTQEVKAGLENILKRLK